MEHKTISRHDRKGKSLILIQWIFVALLILFFFVLYLRAEKTVFNFDVPLHGCAEKVTLVGCNYEATSCKSVKVRFVSATCLTVEAQ
jgi:predicted membrane-bound dolichyl-phosphate-mannose-protein mannosyltransferase